MQPSPEPAANVNIPFEDNEPQIAPFPIVGVGASAGGLEAFTKLLQNVPVDTGMAFVLIQHLDPTHKSELSSLLASATSMRVQEVADGMRIEPNHVYVIPPNTTLQFAERALHLAPRGSGAGPHLTVDHFFRSLAQNQSRLSIGIVLSGTGADGAEGLKAIKSACGITFAQDESSAGYASMPRSAAATGIVDFVLPPQQIAQELARISRNQFVVVPQGQGEKEILPQGDDELKEVFALLLRSTGIDFTHYKTATMRRRIGRRLVVHRFAELGPYVDYLRHHPEEVQELFRDALINVTSFFRDPEAFAAVTQQLSRLLQTKQGARNSFRAWVPGCSTGEEVYSLAICLHELLEESGRRFDIQFFGTDISEGALNTARVGLYPERILDEMSGKRLHRYFTKTEGKYQISKTIRDMCLFARHDVTRDTPFSRLDLVSCRNVLIYLDSVLQRGVFPTFHYALNPGGLLFLGSAETVGSPSEFFQSVDEKHRVFVRRPGPTKHDHLPTWQTKAHVTDTVTQMHVATAMSRENLGSRIERVIRDRYAPDAVVIDNQWQILHFRGHTGFYLEPPSGDANYHLLRMARGELPYVLREVVSQAMQQNAFVEKRGIRVERDSESRTISLEVIPLRDDSDGERFYMVTFRLEGLPPASGNNPAALISEAADQRVKQLQEELLSTRGYQRAMAEEHDAAIEEARALNEELRSSNEELQSSNEELGTTKEELQSANEELTTVNEELDTRNRQLSVLYDDLTNLFAAVTSPVVRVDRDYVIRRITPAGEKLGLGPAELNQPVRVIREQLGTLPDLEPLLRETIDQLKSSTSDFQDRQNRWWSLSIRPYRTADHRIEGAVLTFTETDTIQKALHLSEKARRYADAIIETVREPLVILTSDMKVDRANTSFYKFFRVDAGQVQGKLLFDLGNGQWRIPQLQSQLEGVLPKQLSLSDFEVKHAFPEIGSRIMLLNARRIEQEASEEGTILLAFEDVTVRREHEEAAGRVFAQTSRELDRTKDELRKLASNLMEVREEEDRVIARELHDDFSQRLAFLTITLEQLRLGPLGQKYPDVSEPLAAIQQRVSDLADDIRRLSHRMHPAILEDLGLVAALKNLAEEVGAVRSAKVTFASENVPASVHTSCAHALYRIAQQALGNATKYAPEAPVRIAVAVKGDVLRLVISDQGPGFDEAAVRERGGLGLINMQERAHALGGQLKIRSRPGHGTEISAEIPLSGGGRK